MANIKRPPPSAAILKGGTRRKMYALIVFLIDYVKILQPVAICAIIFVTFPPWSSQMTIILITNAMYHIRYTNSEYGFKRKNPTD